MRIIFFYGEILYRVKLNNQQREHSFKSKITILRNCFF